MREKGGFRVWFVPSMCFMLFIYGMIFLSIYTYNDNYGATLVSERRSGNVIDGEAIKKELKKL